MILDGLSGRVHRDPLWGKPTESGASGQDDHINENRAARFDNPLSLDIPGVLSRIIEAVNRVRNQEIPIEDFTPIFIRVSCGSTVATTPSTDGRPQIDSYHNQGNGISACMALVKIMRRPAHFLNNPRPPNTRPGQVVLAGRSVPPSSSRWYELWKHDDPLFPHVGTAICLAFEKVMAAEEREAPPTVEEHDDNEEEYFEDLSKFALSEDEVNNYLYVRVADDAWRGWRAIEQDNHLPMLFYVAYHRLHAPGFVSP